MFKPIPKRDQFMNRKAFWADKEANARHCAAMEAAMNSATVADWLARFNEARARVIESAKPIGFYIVGQ